MTESTKDQSGRLPGGGTGRELTLTGEMVAKSDDQVAIRIGSSIFLIQRCDIRSMVQMTNAAGGNATVRVAANAKLVQQVSRGLARLPLVAGISRAPVSVCTQCSACNCACNCACACACACTIKQLAMTNSSGNTFRNQLLEAPDGGRMDPDNASRDSAAKDM